MIRIGHFHRTQTHWKPRLSISTNFSIENRLLELSTSMATLYVFPKPARWQQTKSM
jgi:hypothetical protein